MNESKIELPYERGVHLFSSRCSEGFEAIKRNDGSKCLLWVLRYPLKSTETKELVSRLDKIKDLKLPIPKFLEHGMAHSGLIFLLTEHQQLIPVLDSTWIPIELEQRFIAAAKAVDLLHRSEVILGDIGQHTFLLRDKTVVLGPVLGDFDFAAEHTAKLPPPETLNYLAPERTITARPDISSDIFALGIFAYRLFTGEYPQSIGFKAADKIKKPSAIRSDLPSWVDSVIGNCLFADPARRFKDLATLIAKIEESIKSGKAPEIDGIWSKVESSAAKEKPASKELIKVKPKQEDTPKEKPAVVKKQVKLKVKQKFSLVWIFAIIMGLGIAGFLFLAMGSKPEQTVEVKKDSPAAEVAENGDTAISDPLAFVAEYAPAELKPLIIKLADASVDLEQRNAALVELVKSQEPVVFEVLADVIQGNFDLKLKAISKKFLIERLNLVGLSATSGLIQDWISFQTQLSPAASFIFRAVDSSRSPKTRLAVLNEAYLKDPILALRFNAALVLDEGDTTFLENLKSLLTKEVSGEDFSNRGIGALLFSHPSFTVFLDRNLTKALTKFSDEDLTWALLKAAESDQVMLKDLIAEVKSRNIFSALQMYFINVLTVDLESGKTSHVFDRELILAALGKIQSADLYSFARWDSIDAEKVLLAICASSPDPNISKEAFDILAAKSLNNKLAAAFVAWVKGGFWEYRIRIAKAIAILSLSDLVTQAEIEQALDNLTPFAKGGLFRVIASSENVNIVRGALARIGALLLNDDLLSLLSNSNREIRIEAIKSLKNRNEIDVLNAIVKAYDVEQDTEVRKIYNEYHWVTKNRSNKGF